MSNNVLTLKKFRWDLGLILRARGLEERGKVQQYIDSEVLRLNEPFVPKDIAAASQGGNLIQSGIVNTDIGSGEVKYNTPYARRWYYMPAHFQGEPMRGNYWFEIFKQQYRKQVLDGAKKIAKSK